MPTVVPLGHEHVERAAALVARRVARAREAMPLVPATLEDPEQVGGLIARLSDEGLGVAALHGGRVVGFLGALGVPLWGGRGAYVPEWGHIAIGAETITALHEAASRRWISQARTVHTITLWADDEEGEAAWHDLGFGRVVIDTLRDLSPIAANDAGVRRAAPGDAAAVAFLERALWEHLAAPPISRIYPEPAGASAMAERLRSGRRPVWLAMQSSGAVGYLSIEPHDAYPVALAAPHVFRCDGAFVLPEAQRRGIGASLFAAALRWASGSGFSICAVDYESANPQASRFWRSLGCQPVLHAVARRIATDGAG